MNYNKGRIDKFDTTQTFNFTLTGEDNSRNSQIKVLSGIIEASDVAKLYFSRQNIDALQQGIKNKVLKDSDGKYFIDNQSEQELVVIMRYFYLEYSVNLPFDIVEQVKKLNSYVINYCVSNVLSAIDLFYKYKYDVTHIPDPIERGQYASKAGTKSMEFKTFF